MQPDEQITRLTDPEWSALSEAERIDRIHTDQVTARQITIALRDPSPKVRLAAEQKVKQSINLNDNLKELLQILDTLQKAYITLAREAIPELKISDEEDWMSFIVRLNHARPQLNISPNDPMSEIWIRISEELARGRKQRRKKTRPPGPRPQITEKKVRTAIRRARKKKAGPSQNVVAHDLGITDRGLRMWREKEGFATWRDVLDKFS